MSQPLYDLNLQLLDDAQLMGTWRVASRRVNQANPSEAIVRAERLVFEAPNQLVLSSDEVATVTGTLGGTAADGAVSSTGNDSLQLGTWQLERDAMLSRPYLKFMLPTGTVRALITRLRRAKDGSDCEMLLYFQTGMELDLRCTEALPFSIPTSTSSSRS